jgi:hypothetical protein
MAIAIVDVVEMTPTLAMNVECAVVVNEFNLKKLTLLK